MSIKEFFYDDEDRYTFVIHTVNRNGQVWFVAKDVCDVLGIQNPSDAVKGLDEDEKGIEKIPTLGGIQDMLVISESGLYSLVFRSNKPEAKRFSKWVRSEVLPEIRKTGKYEIERKVPAVKTVIKAAKPAGMFQVIKSAEKILTNGGIKGEAMALGLDRVFQAYTGVSVLDIVDFKNLKDISVRMEKMTSVKEKPAYVWNDDDWEKA